MRAGLTPQDLSEALNESFAEVPDTASALEPSLQQPAPRATDGANCSWPGRIFVRGAVRTWVRATNLTTASDTPSQGSLSESVDLPDVTYDIDMPPRHACMCCPRRHMQPTLMHHKVLDLRPRDRCDRGRTPVSPPSWSAPPAALESCAPTSTTQRLTPQAQT